ncbi:hypothetical protein [Ensifer aridi]|uniref:hypothetical protein n=1 Tax=Ensifer aridi TaxID=1708715 RepID=UPI000A10D6CF|nr:hypothetical protein [Ensifer aridi]
MKAKIGKAGKPKAARKMAGKRAIPGDVSHWQVVKARIQEEMTSQAVRRGFTGTVVIESGKLEYSHGGDSGSVSQAELESFAASMMEKGLAAAASTDGTQVAIRLTVATTAILGGRKKAVPVKPKHRSPTLPSPWLTPQVDPKLVIPTPDKLLTPIISNVTTRGDKFADVRAKVASSLSIPSDKIRTPVFDPVVQRNTSFAESFAKAVGHLQKAGLISASGKTLLAIPDTGGKNVPAYKASKAERAKRRASQTARLSGAINVKPLIKGLSDRDPYSLLSTWKNAIRILGDKTRSHQHPPAQAMADAISKEWDRRAKSLADDAYFRWPTTDAPGGRRKEHYRGLREEGMLKYLEYRVGKEGEHSSYRHALLSRIFENALPPVFDRLYMAEWGPNASSIRLHKMAHCLASFAKNFKYQGDDKYDEAIRHWEQDLEYLHDRYYVRKFGFGWPSTAI